MAGRIASGKWGVALLTAGLAVIAPAFAQAPLSDPTRPPPGLAREVEGTMAVSGPVLESVMIPKKGRPLAVISGQTVRVGENYGESRLVRLNEREAVLEGPAGVERLQLTPGIEKTNVVTKNKVQQSSGTRGGSKP